MSQDDYYKLVPQFIVESDDHYHGQRAHFTTSSSLKDYIYNPRIYDLKHRQGKIEKIRSQALYMGSLTHMTVLEGPIVTAKHYHFNAPKNLKTGSEYGYMTKAFINCEEEALAEGHKLARMEDYAVTLQMRNNVFKHNVAKDLIETGVSERVVRLTYRGLPCQIKMDRFTPWGILDLKTSASIENFSHNSKFCDVQKWGYLYSAAFYRLVLHELDKTVPKQPFYFIVVEKEEPYEVGVWRIDDETLEVYEDEVNEYIDKLKISEKDEIWTSPYKELRTI